MPQCQKIVKKYERQINKISRATHIYTLTKNIIHDYCTGEVSIETIESAIVFLADYTRVGKWLLAGWTIGSWLEPLIDNYTNDPNKREQSFNPSPYNRSRTYEPMLSKI